MCLQGDQLIYDKSGDRVISRGNVEIYYNNFILTADEVVYDQSGGTLTAIGNDYGFDQVFEIGRAHV